MTNIIKRILENEFYILYKRVFDKDGIGYSYVIYSEYNNKHIKDFRYLQDAKKFFKKASQEAEQYEKELKHLTRLV